MLIDKWMPLFAPDVETGSDTGGAGTPPPTQERDRGTTGERTSPRKALEDAFEQSRKADQTEERDQRGRFTRGGRRPAQGEGGEEETQERQAGEQEQQQGQQQQEQQQQTIQAPDAFSREAKAEWANTPSIIQAAIIKREQDMAKGVDELKKKYTELDNVLQPRMEIMRRNGHTPAAAVNQLFAWFEALSANPKVAFPALAESFKFDLRTALPAEQQVQQQQQQTPQQIQQQQQGEIPGPVQTYIKGLEDKLEQLTQGITAKFGTLEQTFQQQSEAKTKEILDRWAEGKPHFEEVRVIMGNLIATGVVPPLPNGAADLDKAYDMAVYANPEVRAKILAEQQQKAEAERKAQAEKERKAQQEQANKARKAGGSLSLNAPGETPEQKGQRKRGKSVRESLQEAIEESRS